MARCLYCSVEATDPTKGPSRWTRAVVDGDQVLICPDCAASRPDWIERAQACEVCRSKKLYKAMGDVVCRACGHQWTPGGDGIEL